MTGIQYHIPWGINPDGQGVNEWWPGKYESSVYKLFGSYIPVTTTMPGEGYWMKHIGANVYNTGDEWPEGGIQTIPNDPISAVAGWYLIGGYEIVVTVASLTTTPPGLITGIIYTYSDKLSDCDYFRTRSWILCKIEWGWTDKHAGWICKRKCRVSRTLQ